MVSDYASQGKSSIHNPISNQHQESIVTMPGEISRIGLASVQQPAATKPTKSGRQVRFPDNYRDNTAVISWLARICQFPLNHWQGRAVALINAHKHSPGTRKPRVALTILINFFSTQVIFPLKVGASPSSKGHKQVQCYTCIINTYYGYRKGFY